MKRHYSWREYSDHRPHTLFVGPGEKMVLLTLDCQALFVWRRFIDDCIPKQRGVNCAVFRNESPLRSSDLIRAAEQIAWGRWPGERLYTYVNAAKIRSSNPGWCFQCAGWGMEGHTKTGLVILAKEAAAQWQSNRQPAM